MKIAQITQTSMVLKDNNFSGIIFGAVFAVLGFILLYSMHPLSKPFSLKTWLPAIFILVGLFVIAMSRFTTIILDKAQNKIIVIGLGILGKRVKEYPLNTVMRLELREEYRIEYSNADSRGFSVQTPRLNWQLVFVFNDGQEVPLDHVTSSASTVRFDDIPLMSGSGTERVVGQKIAAFLNIPFQEIGPGMQTPTIGQMTPPINPTPPIA